ncbi:response regulator transcription factor [bacterium]|nr:MAG: response regulator transcription factor [bacterium]
MSGKHILIADDEPRIGEVLAAYLQREGFRISLAETAARALELALGERPDLMILDLTLPDGSGLDVFRDVQAEASIPTIILTARADEIDRIVGLEMGADDYVTKPFSPREVSARVRAVLRRTTREPEERREEPLHVGDLMLDSQAHEVRVGGDLVPVTPAEFRILQAFFAHAGQVLTREELLDILDDTGTIYERTLDRHVNNLRRKIETDVERPQYILTVYGVGYKLRRE